METRRRGKTRPHIGEGGVIEALVSRGKSQERVVVRLHDGGALELARVLVERANLQPGMVLSAALLERLMADDAPYRARERALRLLEVRDRSARELESRLRAEGLEPAVVSSTLDWLRGLGYIDDRRFASRFASAKLAAGWGVRRIRVGLLQKGVDRAVIEESLAEALPAEAERPGALQEAPTGVPGEGAVEGLQPVLALARRRFAAQFATDPQKAGRRLAGFLARRGHDWETIDRIEALLRAEAASDADGSAGGPDAGSEVDGRAGFS
jgi:regulatory protein